MFVHDKPNPTRTHRAASAVPTSRQAEGVIDAIRHLAQTYRREVAGGTRVCRAIGYGLIENKIAYLDRYHGDESDELRQLIAELYRSLDCPDEIIRRCNSFLRR